MISKFLNNTELKKLKLGHLGRNCKISNKTSFIGNQNIFLGDNTRIDDYTILVAHDGLIKIGDNTHIGSLTYILGSGLL